LSSGKIKTKIFNKYLTPIVDNHLVPLYFAYIIELTGKTILMANIIAIVWDYDGTLVDTRQKNLSVNRRIISQITGIPADVFSSLRSLANYDVVQKEMTNWQDLYQKNYGMNHDQTVRAGQLWSEYQKEDDTDTPIYFGIKEVVESLRHLPQGIFSQNSKSQIENVLNKNKLSNSFNSIIGYQELEHGHQKPEPHGLLESVKNLTSNECGIVLFIGDHVTDFKCAINANSYYFKNHIRITVKTIGVNYTPDADPSSWEVRPDFIADRPLDILEIAGNLERESND